MEISVGTHSSVRYLVEVRYWECPLIESPLYSDHEPNEREKQNIVKFNRVAHDIVFSGSLTIILRNLSKKQIL